MNLPPSHHLRLPSQYVDAAPFKIEGVYCRLIQLNRGMYAIVDADDYERLAHWRWYAWRNPRTGHYYARRNGSRLLNEPCAVLMHREVAGLSFKDGLTVDHIEIMATLDNRRKNLRVATYGQNAVHSRKPRNNVSGFKGVSFHPHSGLWRSRVHVDGVERTTYHETKLEAYAARRLSSAKYFGEFANVKENLDEQGITGQLQ
jgi:hypothetical protein